VQLIEVVVIDSTQVIHTVGHVKMIGDVISQIGLVDSSNAVIYLFQHVLTIARTIGKSKKAVIFFQMVIVL
jgi:hypothetical protein